MKKYLVKKYQRKDSYGTSAHTPINWQHFFTMGYFTSQKACSLQNRSKPILFNKYCNHVNCVIEKEEKVQPAWVMMGRANCIHDS